MDPLLTEALRQVPALGVLVFLIIKFLSFLSEHQKAETIRTEKIAAALEKNTELFGRVIECLNHSEQALEEHLEEGSR